MMEIVRKLSLADLVITISSVIIIIYFYFWNRQIFISIFRTDDYDCTKKRKVNGKVEEAELVVRRGDSIKMTLTFDRPYSKEKNDLKLCFSLGR
jgi:hypothetical protein